MNRPTAAPSALVSGAVFVAGAVAGRARVAVGTPADARAALRRFVGVLSAAGLVLSLAAFVVLGLGPLTGRYRILTVLSGSMEPAVPTGSVVVVVPVRLADIAAGDVITYQAPRDGAVLTHRVVEVVEPGRHPVIRTKGDANRDADPWLSRLLHEPGWRVRTVVPGLGHVLGWIHAEQLQRVVAPVAPSVLAALAIARIWRRRPAVTGLDAGDGARVQPEA